MNGSSQNYDGGNTPPRSAKKRLALNGRLPEVVGSRGKRGGHGVGAHTSRCYCATCGAKKAVGVCPRCSA